MKINQVLSQKIIACAQPTSVKRNPINNPTAFVSINQSETNISEGEKVVISCPVNKTVDV
jgi:hypothetical protein